VLDCKGFSPEAESSNASVEAVGFCQDSGFPLAATGSLDGVVCIWDISRGVSTDCSCVVLIINIATVIYSCHIIQIFVVLSIVTVLLSECTKPVG
jgi:WD40 repeat protein